MSANKRTTSREFEELLEILESSTRMAGDVPFSAFIDRDAEGSDSQVGFTCRARHTACDRAEE
jgi:hypothetical protein